MSVVRCFLSDVVYSCCIEHDDGAGKGGVAVIDVGTRGGAHEVGPQNAFWVHHSADGKRMVIHTRQLSGAVSDKLLEEMGNVIRQHINSTINTVTEHSTKRKLRIGMSMDECRNIWGNPQNISKTTFSNRETETWIYSAQKLLIFENGILHIIKE